MAQFIVKTHGLKSLEKFYKKAPRQFSRASAGLLNNLAFETRNRALVNIASDMHIRNDRFVSSRMRVDRAKAGFISGQQSQVGSVATARFSGWVEQELGKAPLRNRVFNVAGGRRGSEQNIATGKARLKPSNHFFTIGDFSIRSTSEDHRLIVFLQIMSRQHPNEPFIIQRKYRKLSKGVYMFTKRGQLKQMQSFKPMHVKRKPWLRPARHHVATQANIRRLWARAISRVIK